MNPIKILEITAIDSTIKAFLTPLIKTLQGNGYIVEAACTSGEWHHQLANQGIKIHPVQINRNLDPLSVLRSVYHLCRLLRRGKYQVVHVHTPVAAVIGRVAAWLARVPVVIYTAHGFYFHEGMSPVRRRLFYWVEKAAALITDYIFTVSPEDQELALSKKIIDHRRITCLNSIGVDVERYSLATVRKLYQLDQLRQELSILPGDRVVGLVARLEKEKGCLEFIEAARNLSDRANLKFLIIGSEGPLEQELHQAANSSDLKGKLILTGFREDVPALLALMDVFVLPSYREGMPRSIIEAMAMALPVVATNIRGCREEVVEGITGFLVSVGDGEQLAERIGFLLDNPDEAVKMGTLGRQRAEDIYDERPKIAHQLEVISRLCAEKGLLPREMEDVKFAPDVQKAV